MVPVLEFNELDDLIAYLEQEGQADWVHLELGHTASERDSTGVRAISFYAIVTRHFLTPSEYIAVWACPVLSTTSLHLQMDKHESPEHQTRTLIHGNLDKVKTQLETRGLTARPGKWMAQPPEYLR